MYTKLYAIELLSSSNNIDFTNANSIINSIQFQQCRSLMHEFDGLLEKTKENRAVQSKHLASVKWKKPRPKTDAENFCGTRLLVLHCSKPIFGSVKLNIKCSMKIHFSQRNISPVKCCALIFFHGISHLDTRLTQLVCEIIKILFNALQADNQSENTEFDVSEMGVCAFANVTSGNFDAYANYTRNPLSSAALYTHTQSPHTHFVAEESCRAVELISLHLN